MDVKNLQISRKPVAQIPREEVENVAEMPVAIGSTEAAETRPRKSERLSAKSALRKAIARDYSLEQLGSDASAAASAESYYAHLSQGQLPFMAQDDYKERMRQMDRVLARLAEAQENDVKV